MCPGFSHNKALSDAKKAAEEYRKGDFMRLAPYLGAYHPVKPAPEKGEVSRGDSS